MEQILRSVLTEAWSQIWPAGNGLAGLDVQAGEGACT